MLATALEDAVAYLRQLPVVPATSLKIRDLEAVLASESTPAQRAEARSASGLTLFEAEVSKGKLNVRTDLPAERATVLWRALFGEGVHVVLQTPDERYQPRSPARRGR